MAKKVIRQILLIYLTTTGIFLAIFFTLWYQKLYEELVVVKGTSLRENHRNIIINILNSRFVPMNESASNIAQSTGLKLLFLIKNKLFLIIWILILEKQRLNLRAGEFTMEKYFS